MLGSSWGPTREELLDAATRAVTGGWDEQEMSTHLQDAHQLSGSDDGDSDDSDLLDAVELADYVDYHHDFEDVQ
jgi:hypothetical protein